MVKPKMLRRTKGTTVNTAEEVRDDLYLTTNKMIDNELHALNTMNEAEAVKKFSELFDLSATHLMAIRMYGIEEANRRILLLEEKIAHKFFSSEKGNEPAETEEGVVDLSGVGRDETLMSDNDE